MALLEVKNLKKSFGGTVVLKDASFSLEKSTNIPLCRIRFHSMM